MGGFLSEWGRKKRKNKERKERITEKERRERKEGSQTSNLAHMIPISSCWVQFITSLPFASSFILIHPRYHSFYPINCPEAYPSFLFLSLFFIFLSLLILSFFFFVPSFKYVWIVIHDDDDGDESIDWGSKFAFFLSFSVLFSLSSSLLEREEKAKVAKTLTSRVYIFG